MSAQMDQVQGNNSDSSGAMPAAGMAALVQELDVSNLPESLTFWVDILGFRVAYARPAAGFAFLERDAVQIMLCQISGEWMTGTLDRPFGRGVNFQMRVADIDALAKVVQAADWPLFRPVEEKQYRVGDAILNTKEFLVQDPDGPAGCEPRRQDLRAVVGPSVQWSRWLAASQLSCTGCGRMTPISALTFRCFMLAENTGSRLLPA